MNIDLHELKILATAAKSNPYDAVAGNDYGMAMPPAVTLGLIAEIERHRQKTNTEGWKPEINIQPSDSHTAAPTVVHGLNKAEGDQPDLNFHLLQLAERSCSLLEDWVQLTDTANEALTEQIKATRSLLQSQSPTWSIAVRDLLAERRRQVREEGYTPGKDDQYTYGELAQAASTYAFWADPRGARPDDHIDYLNSGQQGLWPWAKECWKPTNQRLMLIKAGALILAELDRLDRRAAREAHHD
ncbi:hypothetical protein V0R50_21055 [Pseudomonas sp. 148P]|uniref:Phage protein n=1 Tax=Pseudomonas ulcerans TaxID=3115852 RepID=A0ABU7HW01_9PSED|nr:MULTISPECIES: hypothetical protein [unclassified Pseudomonas]MEE1922877.1 hypothetical protein [Pseudomonas sp. 147P]MEE1935727.1 hypothetical protein [Pseudomonas sp. 148P]